MTLHDWTKTHTPTPERSQYEVSRLSFLAMQEVMRTAQKWVGWALDLSIDWNIEDIEALIDTKTSQFIMAKYIELLFRSCLMLVDISLGEEDIGKISYKSPRLSWNCNIQIFTDREDFELARSRLEDLWYSGDDIILVFEEAEKIKNLTNLLEIEYSKTNRWLKSTRDFLYNLLRKLPRSVTKEIWVEFSSPQWENLFSTKLLRTFNDLNTQIEELRAKKKKW